MPATSSNYGNAYVVSTRGGYKSLHTGDEICDTTGNMATIGPAGTDITRRLRGAKPSFHSN